MSNNHNFLLIVAMAIVCFCASDKTATAAPGPLSGRSSATSDGTTVTNLEPARPVPVPEREAANLQALFQKYYPGAMFTNEQANGIRIEYAVTDFEFPYTGPPNAKHEATTQRGPKPGGILCVVYANAGRYQGQLMMPDYPGRSPSALPTVQVNRKVYRELIAAPYSEQANIYLWAVLSYPPDAKEEFLKEYQALLVDFQKDGIKNQQEAPSGNGK